LSLSFQSCGFKTRYNGQKLGCFFTPLFFQYKLQTPTIEIAMKDKPKGKIQKKEKLPIIKFVSVAKVYYFCDRNLFFI